ncbi:NUDIX hydrolase [Pseudalkalibacillus sp. Hm43]|uniref:NUDIX hydrolase n=1 Tax=Pseudalkalibacillus sp. Hm43 TaxID=3450742 RepID=UPI003F438D46
MGFKPLLRHRDTTVNETKTGSLFIEESESASVAVVAMRGTNLVVVEQYRHQLGKNTFELPGGGLDSGEEPIAGARRELEEETGIQAGKLIPLGTFFPQPYFTNRHSHLFFTEETHQTGMQNLDEDEDISVHQIPVSEVLESIEQGHYADGELGYALFLCMLKGYIRKG